MDNPRERSTESDPMSQRLEEMILATQSEGATAKSESKCMVATTPDELHYIPRAYG